MITAFTPLLTNIALLLLRGIVAIVFFSSGKSHMAKPGERGAQIDMPAGITLFLGISEVVAALSVAFGIYLRPGAIILMLTMMGAIYMKTVRWKTGFYADKGYGWHYDLLLFCAALVLFATGGGAYVLIP